MADRHGSQGNRGGGAGASKRGGGGGGSRRDGDVRLSPNPRRNVDGNGGGARRTDNHREGDSSLDKQSHGGSHPVQIKRKEEMDMEGREEDLTTKKIRIHVGGLGESVTSDDLCGTFSKLGVEIEAVDIVRSKGRSFAYIDFSHRSLDALPKLFNTYNGCAWKGGRLRLEKAKENYLDRMKREWDENAELARNTSTSNADVITYYTEPAERLKKGIASEKQLRVFFPRLRKIKSLPFTGTGKHKYSFRRVEVPPLPTYFCDCEEHCGSLYRVGEKQIPAVENQGGGMNKEEIDLMNSVMHKLFGMENVSSAVCNDVELTKEEDDSVEEINDLQVDESEGSDDDNLIINVVKRGKGTTRLNQDSNVNKRKASNDGPTLLPLKKKARNSEENKANESLPMVSGGEGSLPAQLNVSAITSGGKNIKSESSIKQLGSTVSWSQKSSWRELVGDKSNSSITISDILPSTSSNKKKTKKAKQQELSTLPNFSDSENEKSLMSEYQGDDLDKKVEADTEAQPTVDSASEKGRRYSSKKDKKQKVNALLNFSDGENENSLMHEYHRHHLDKKVEDTVEAEPTKMDSASEKAGRDENEKSPMHEYQRDHLDNEVEDTAEAQPTRMESDSENEGDENKKSLAHEYQRDLDNKAEDTAQAEPTKTDSASENGGRDENNKSLMREYQEDPLDKNVEDTAEAQPIKPVSSSTGRGSTWLHKSSWTQLVAGTTGSSFSIRQILPDIAFDKLEPVKTDVAITTSGGNRDDVMIEKTENDSLYGVSGSSIHSDTDVQRTIEATSIGDNNAPAPAPAPTKQSLCRNVADLGTFSFKRTDESVQEWKTIKAALSAKRKRTNKKE
ncbi:RNA-binding (RRM/RBD/RNP motifs) family protein [Euphorbia peplus]|nr:RNA-binding (RRM/RBD/RNP motifs) family protein [Euphorbia peplus]